VVLSECVEGGRWLAVAKDTARLAISDFNDVGGRGGGYGDMDMLITEVEWAW
jgi:hypothetical protein